MATPFTKFDARQTISRDQLQQLLPYLSGQELDNLLRSIDSDLSVPCRMDASDPADLIVNVQSALISNPESFRNRSISHISNTVPSFSSGTITFPASSGGNIVPSPGTPVVLTIPASQYVKVLISLDAGGNLIASPGSADPVEANAAVPAPIPNSMPIGWVTVFNNAGTIDNIDQAHIYQFAAGGGGSSGSQSGFAQEVSIPNGNSSLVVNFPSSLPGTNYVVIAEMVNTIDGSPQFQDITITAKSASGFTATWNAPTDSANYKLAYIVPVVQEQIGETTVPLGVDTLTVNLPIVLAGSNYSVIAQLVNIVDGSPQFQTVLISAKTASTFTANWTAPTDSANYRLAYHLAEFQ